MKAKLLLATLATALSLGNTYPRAMEITKIDSKTDTATCVDAVGHKWKFKGPEDLEEGDLVICTMHNNGTTDTILDDRIVDVIWSGYWVEGNELKCPERR